MFILNRPEKLNALTLSMIRNIAPQLKVSISVSDPGCSFFRSILKIFWLRHGMFPNLQSLLLSKEWVKVDFVQEMIFSVSIQAGFDASATCILMDDNVRYPSQSTSQRSRCITLFPREVSAGPNDCYIADTLHYYP